MINVTPHMKIMVAIEPTDFRLGIDGLCALCRDHFNLDPFSGILFVFRNRSGTAIKMLCYDESGFWLLQKRFCEGKLKWWPTSSSEPLTPLAAKHLQVIIYNGIPSSAQFADDWRKLSL